MGPRPYRRVMTADASAQINRLSIRIAATKGRVNVIAEERADIDVRRCVCRPVSRRTEVIRSENPRLVAKHLGQGSRQSNGGIRHLVFSLFALQ